MPTIHRADEGEPDPIKLQHKIAIAALVVAIVSAILAYLNYSKPPPPAGPTIITGPITIINTGLTAGVRSQHASPPPEIALCGNAPGNLTHGWGPMRTMYDGVNPTPVPALNSLSSSPWGDERNFYGIRDATAPLDAEWQTTLKLERDHSYDLRIIISNGASAQQPQLALQETRAMLNLPACTGKYIRTDAFVDAKNTNPTEVYQSIGLYADEPFNLNYQSSSARQCTNTNPCNRTNDAQITGGLQLAEDIFTNRGVSVGTNALNGIVQGGNNNAVMILFRVHPQFAGQ